MTKDIVSVDDVIDGVYRLRGFNPDNYSPTPRERENYAALVTDATITAWEDQPWPLLMTVDFRRYRPDWAEGVFWRVGQDCWHNGRYWHCVHDCMGVVPGTNETVWEAVPEGSIGYKFIAFEQPWTGRDGLAMESIDPTGVELGAFAYMDDPMTVADARVLTPCRMAAECIFLPEHAPDGVWIRYRPACPVFDLDDYDAARTYHVGDVCHSGRDCWRCRALSLSGVAPADDEPRWERVGIPRFMLQYVRRRLQAELASEDEGKYKSEALADKELERLRDKWINTANGNAKLRFAAPRRGARP